MSPRGQSWAKCRVLQLRKDVGCFNTHHPPSTFREISSKLPRHCGRYTIKLRKFRLHPKYRCKTNIIKSVFCPLLSCSLPSIPACFYRLKTERKTFDVCTAVVFQISKSQAIDSFFFLWLVFFGVSDRIDIRYPALDHQAMP